jgi:hypothetical protein
MFHINALIPIYIENQTFLGLSMKENMSAPEGLFLPLGALNLINCKYNFISVS